ncbi:hypothetical protein BU25DRAFT_495799 [Macroventuria anomochaeta]|uniref:Uncharacterized protein n=1 Tax=Macroventuria anomochaeta TaxID=301207 RepID=A0ACB6RHE0_9PLEO|nr:uncharacterized protein BU25DRAFT_495799 [Macroventuria anomochaeta]KAF2621365.1 hypothetical protein BU25DRAFT_495799 [Macroventuria anomochaeta]
MSPAPINQDAAASASPPQQQSTPQAIAPSAQPVSRHFDDIFHARFMQVIADWKNDPSRGSLTQKDRKTFIENAYIETDELYFSRRQLSDQEVKLRALTKVFYKILAEEPWSEDWIRAPDVERKLSRFEMHKDSIELAAKFNVVTPREAVRAAREAATKQEEALKAAGDKPVKELRIDRGPWDDIEIIYIPGTVSAAATSRLNREETYPISVSSVAATLQSHICRDMVRPFSMAERFVNCSDTRELEEMREFACNVCDYCPHLLDNDNVSLLVVLLILSRSDVCRRWENNGIRIEGSTISHRKSECMKNKLGWNTTELKKPFDNFATEFQTRVKNACFPAPRAQRGGGPKNKAPRKSSTPATPSTPTGYGPNPVWAYMPSPQVRHDGVNAGINIPAPAMQTIYKQPTAPAPPASASNTTGGNAVEPMDIS